MTSLPEEEERLVQEAIRCTDAKSATHWPSVANVLADEVERLRTAHSQLTTEFDALRVDIRAVLDQLAAQAAVHESRRMEQYGPSAPLQRAYGRGIEYAVDRIRASLGSDPQVKP